MIRRCRSSAITFRAAPTRRISRRRNGSIRFSALHLFDNGWNNLRDTIFANQKRLGVIPQDTKLTPWPDKLLNNWDQCTPEDKKLFIRQVEVYAAYLAYTDHEIGRVIEAVERDGQAGQYAHHLHQRRQRRFGAEGSPVGTPSE